VETEPHACAPKKAALKTLFGPHAVHLAEILRSAQNDCELDNRGSRDSVVHLCRSGLALTPCFNILQRATASATGDVLGCQGKP